MSGLNEIWNNEKGKLPEDKLLAYVEGKLPPAEQYEVERWLADEGMESDAIEGLTYLDAGETQHTVGRLNHKLKVELTTGKKRGRRKVIKDNPWAIIAVIIILLLVILAYVAIRMTIKK